MGLFVFTGSERDKSVSGVILVFGDVERLLLEVSILIKGR